MDHQRARLLASPYPAFAPGGRSTPHQDELPSINGARHESKCDDVGLCGFLDAAWANRRSLRAARAARTRRHGDGLSRDRSGERARGRAQATAVTGARTRIAPASSRCSSASFTRSRSCAHPRVIEVYDYGVRRRGAVLHDGAARRRRPARARAAAVARSVRACSATCARRSRCCTRAGCCTATSARATCAARATAAPS